jgi:hypothetical protein
MKFKRNGDLVYNSGFCCEELKREIESKNIGLYYYEWSDKPELDIGVTYDTGEWEGEAFLNYIKFCPWCGSDLEPEIVES